MSEENKKNVLLENLASLSEPENFQKYILGYKKHGQPRAVYDIIKDMSDRRNPKKHKKKKSGKGAYGDSTYDMYLRVKGKKKKKKNKHWHI